MAKPFVALSSGRQINTDHISEVFPSVDIDGRDVNEVILISGKRVLLNDEDFQRIMDVIDPSSPEEPTQ